MSEQKNDPEVQTPGTGSSSPMPHETVPSPYSPDEQLSGQFSLPLTGFVAARYSGPIPPATELKALKEVEPSFPEKLLQMAQAEQEHAHEMNRLTIEMDRRALEINAQIVQEDQRLFGRGQTFGFALGTITVFTGAVTALLGAPIPGAFIGTGGVAALIAAFVYGSRRGVIPGGTGRIGDSGIVPHDQQRAVSRGEEAGKKQQS